MKKLYGILLLVFLTHSVTFPQEKTKTKFGAVCKFEFNNTAFPHPKRSDGRVYKNEHFNAKEHYQDQSTIIFIPKNFVLSDSIDFVFYFHGWGNNIDTSLTRFNLLEQFYKSKKNAILVLSETAKNSKDSYGGHLEEKGVFADLLDEVIDELNEIYAKELNVGDISLAGHSGAYRIMAYILTHGGVTKNIEAVYLFDALYADVEKYTYWLDNYNGRFINIYTPNGGTVSESENLMKCLEGWEIPFELIEDDNFSSHELKDERIVFIKSKLGHSQVIHTKNQFQKILESSF